METRKSSTQFQINDQKTQDPRRANEFFALTLRETVIQCFSLKSEQAGATFFPLGIGISVFIFYLDFPLLE